MSEDPCEELRKEAHRVGREIEQAARYLRRFAGTKPLNPWGAPMPLTEESIQALREAQGVLENLQEQFKGLMDELVECMKQHGQIIGD
ncbi:MAG: hypothetical protein E3J30_10875 [Anaerolineales bacterium]|nr:MAG: hypothetical protein E3J30_10875 [Anaerolineales bacterium]